MPQQAHLNTSVRQTISRGLVALFKQYVGRGPATARTFINENVVTVILEDTLTAVEQTLTDSARPDVVAEMRRSFQEAVCDEAIALVEEATGRTVKAFLSDHSVLPDYAVECFILTPDESEGQDPDPCESIAARGGEPELIGGAVSRDGGSISRDGSAADGAGRDGVGPDGSTTSQDAAAADGG